ncbi:MAG: HAD hydrolase family protein [Mycoplasma sp.]|nr:HAD hydrolase family protein [Mycoplasma sp.]
MLFDEASNIEELKGILEFCDKKDINYSISTDKKAYFKKGVPEKEMWFWDVFMDKIEPLEKIDPKEKTIHQLTIRTEDMNDIDEIEKYLSINNKFTVNSKWDRGCFISRLNTHKASGLIKLSEILGTTIENVIAFGDGSNDKEMLEQVGYSVAMDNASDELKSLSDDVIGTADDFAVIDKLKQMSIIK